MQHYLNASETPSCDLIASHSHLLGADNHIPLVLQLSCHRCICMEHGSSSNACMWFSNEGSGSKTSRVHAFLNRGWNPVFVPLGPASAFAAITLNCDDRALTARQK